jgi:hypothetical protein
MLDDSTIINNLLSKLDITVSSETDFKKEILSLASESQLNKKSIYCFLKYNNKYKIRDLAQEFLVGTERIRQMNKHFIKITRENNIN